MQTSSARKREQQPTAHLVHFHAASIKNQTAPAMGSEGVAKRKQTTTIAPTHKPKAPQAIYPLALPSAAGRSRSTSAGEPADTGSDRSGPAWYRSCGTPFPPSRTRGSSAAGCASEFSEAVLYFGKKESKNDPFLALVVCCACHLPCHIHVPRDFYMRNFWCKLCDHALGRASAAAQKKVRLSSGLETQSFWLSGREGVAGVVLAEYVRTNHTVLLRRVRTRRLRRITEAVQREA